MSLLDIARLGLQIDASQVRDGDRALADFTRTGAQAEGAADRVNAGMKRLAAAAKALAGAMIVREVIEAQRNFDKLFASLTTATGSVDNAKQAFKALSQFAATTPYGLAEVTEAFIKMRNLGLDPSEAALRSYGNTSAAMGKSLNDMVEAVADAATGEFERLKEFGIKSKVEGDKVSFTFQGTTKKIGNSAAEIEKYLQDLGNTKFGGGMELRAATLDGAISNLGDTWDATMLKISQTGAGDLAKDMVVGLTSAMGDFSAILDEATKAGDDQTKSIDRVGIVHKALRTVFETIAVLGVNFAYVLTAVGKEIGGLAAQAVAVLHGDFAGAKAIGDQMKKDADAARIAVDAKTVAILGASEKAQKANEAEAAALKASGEDRLAKYKIAREAAAKSEADEKKRAAAAKKAAAELAKQSELLASLAGLSPDFAEKWDALGKVYKAGKIDIEALTKAQAELLAQQPAMVASAKAEADEREAIAAATAGFIDPMYERIEAMREEVARNEELAAQVGMTAVQVERLEIARLRDTLAQAASKDLTEKEIFDLQTLITLRERNAAALTATGVGVTTEPQKLLDIMEALDEATKSAAQGMADAFGSVGSAIGDLTTALSGYGRTQAAIAAQLDETIKGSGGDEVKIAKARADAARQSSQAQLKSYGDMAKAAKGFFKENTTGYRALEGAEKAYRAFEMALAVKTMIEKSGLLQAFTGLFVASKATETAATVASVGPDVAASVAKGQAAAAAGVAGQAQGDPYTAFARMAAMAAAMAALGFAVSGGGKKYTTAADRQKAQGTGTVLGDKSAKSDSIARSIAVVSQNSGIELSYTQGMLRALNSIDSKIGDFASLLVRTTDVNGEFGAQNNKSVFSGKGIGAAGAIGGGLAGAAGGAWLGMGAGMLSVLGGPVTMILGGLLGAILGKNFLGKALGSIFGGKQTVQDSGFTLGATNMAAINAGQLNGMQYADIKKDGGWFRSDKLSTQTESIGAEGNRQIAAVLSSMFDAVTEAGKLLGIGGDAFTQRLNAFVVDIGKISTKGLSGEEIEKQLQAAFSKVGDEMARFAVGGIEQFQKVGEGALETLARVASNYANLDSVLASVGMTFGATGLSSIAARENLIELAGGIDELASQTASFAENFLTEAERLAPVQKYVADQLAAMGLAALDTRDKFADYVLALDLTNPAMQAQYVALMDLQAAFAKTHAASVDLSKSEQEIADERAGLQDQLDDLLLSTAEKAAKARAALDPLNRTLFDQVELARAATDAHEAAKSSLQSLSDEYRNFAKGLEAFGLSLVTGSLSTLNIAGQEAAARAQYEKTAAAALAGDKGALADFEKVAGQFLTISQKANGGDSKYMSDYARVLAMTDKLASYATDRADLAMMQLDAAERSANGIEELIAILRGSEATLASLATRPPEMPLTAVDNGNALRDEMRALAATISATSTAAVTSAEKMAALQAQENNRVTMAGAEKVAEAVTSTAKTRASAANTTAALDA